MRMKTGLFVSALLLIPSLALGGDLNPPPGPVRSTMQPLSALEPRICVNDLPGDEAATVIITEPGNYFLRANIQALEGQTGIRIETAGAVNIDLEGCCVLPPWPPQTSVSAISFVPTDLSVQSTLILTSTGGNPGMIAGWGSDGIHTDGVAVCICTHLVFNNNGGAGAMHIDATRVVHTNTSASGNVGDGVRVRERGSGLATGRRQHSFSHCSSSGNGGTGFNIDCPRGDFGVDFVHSSATGNGGVGFGVDVNGQIPGNNGTSDQGVCHFGHCFAVSNTGNGIDIDLPVSNQTAIAVESSACIGNGGDGYRARGAQAGGRHRGHVTILKLSEFKSNGGSGTNSDNPLHSEGCTFAENALFGSTVNGPDATELIARDVDGIYFRNGLGGMLVDRGRFSCTRGQFSDNGGSGISCLDGCIVMDRCEITRSTLCGVEVNGTLNMTACTLRRNDEAGCKTRNGACVMTDTVCELNGMGAVFEDCTTVTMTRCVFNDNTGVGVQNRSVVGPVRWMAPECVASRNGTHGFDLRDVDGGTLDRCVASGNGGNGFELGQKADRCRVERCTSTANGGVGFNILGTGNLIVGNRATGGAVGGYNIGVGNVRGPILTAATLITNTNPDANIEY